MKNKMMLTNEQSQTPELVKSEGENDVLAFTGNILAIGGQCNNDGNIDQEEIQTITHSQVNRLHLELKVIYR